MDVLTVVALVVAGACAAAGWRRPPRRRWAVAVLLALVVAGVLAFLATGAPDRGTAAATVVASVVVAVAGGGPVTEQVLRLADRSERAAGTGDGSVADASLLRGGAWIGALERAGIAVSLLFATPEGVAIVLAIKGLGRYPELREPAAAERFIVGTFTSALVAAAAAGVAVLALS